MRKLASIQTITNLVPIPDADFIEMATVMGWNVVVKKGEFQVGDKCVFFEIDSQLPDGAEWAEFLRSKKFRVRTCKLRGVLSQGLVLSTSILGDEDFPIGTDVTEILGVKKYEPAPKFGFKSGNTLGDFPSFIPKTDEIRVQSALGVLDEIKEQPFYYTVKCDGTSATFYHMDGHFGACSRNQEKAPGDNIYWQMVAKYNIDQKIPTGFALQGEICGPGVQKNKLMLMEPELFIFDVFDIRAGRYFGYKQMLEMCEQLELPVVPLEEIVRKNHFVNFDFSLEAWLERAKGMYEGTDNLREGIVVRPLDERYSPTLRSRLSFKVLNNDFLLKYEGTN